MSSKLDRIMQRSAQLGADIQSLQQKPAAPDQAPRDKGWQPRFEIYQHQDHLFIDVELPGVPPESLQIEPNADMLVVRGEKPNLAQVRDREEIASTREFGPFSSQFAVPPGYVMDRFEQRLDHGVLSLKVRIVPRSTLPDGSRA